MCYLTSIQDFTDTCTRTYVRTCTVSCTRASWQLVIIFLMTQYVHVVNNHYLLTYWYIAVKNLVFMIIFTTADTEVRREILVVTVFFNMCITQKSCFIFSSMHSFTVLNGFTIVHNTMCILSLTWTGLLLTFNLLYYPPPGMIGCAQLSG